ncbi:MAG: GNAT family N-acetyltransferase [Proteobacteria bacterium]|nr:GNAT family N-acetyltransferase [Pseudomonadota bacterium]
MSLKIVELTKAHNRKQFDCGDETLNTFLKTQARQKNTKNIAKTRIICQSTQPTIILGYYTLTGHSAIAPKTHKLYQNYPELLSGVKLAKLAIDKAHQTKGYSSYLIMDAIMKTIETSFNIASIGLFVDPKTIQLQTFYKKHGFITVNPDSNEMWIPTETCKQLSPQPSN